LLGTKSLAKNYGRIIRKNLSQNKKPRLKRIQSFGSSAIFFPNKTRRFPAPSNGGFGFIGRMSFVFEIVDNLTKAVDFVNTENQIMKIIFSPVN
jgi:hypothetical protein